ncbi:tail fiber [Bacillus phage vB_BanS-Thrax1]|nr:tail fiber [Bacillus phage vB_BanS-Thrax1]
MPNIIGTGQMSLVDLNDVIASPTAPNNPIDGALWWNTTENKLYVYSNGQWVFSSDGMVFGGVNLLRNTTFNNLTKWSGLVAGHVIANDFLGSTSARLTRTNWATGNPRAQFSQNVTLIPFTQKGFQYTFGGWVYVDSSVAMTGAGNDIAVRIYKASDNSMRDYIITDLTTLEKDKWVYVKKTFTLLEDIQRMDVLFSLNQNGLIKVARPQLETGNIASNWSPAPEDGEETISEIQKTLNNLADDNILDYNERQIIKDKLTELTGMVIPNGNTAMPDIGYIDAENNNAKGLIYNVRKQARQMAISTDDPKYKAVETTYSALRTYLGTMTPKPWNVDPAIKDQVITVANKDTFRTTWLNLYLAINDLASYTVEKAKEATDNTGVIANGGDNYISNGDFRLDITKSLWKANYVGDVKEIVDISAQAPPHQFALHIKNNSAKNGGIFTPVIWDANIAEAMINRDVTISFWLKYSGITQGAQSYMAGRFGELIIEGAKADGTVASTKYLRFSNPTTIQESTYITGTNTTWVKYSATVKITPHATASKITRISFKHGIEACVGEFWTTGIKLEIGNKETPWSESPVDIYDRIGKAELAVKPESIVATVTGSSQYKTDIQGAKDYAKDEAKAQFDKVLTTRNLILDSHADFNTVDYLINDYTTTEDLVAGQKYTIVIKGTLTAGQKFGLWMNRSATMVGELDITSSANTLYSGVYYLTFTAIAPTAGNERSLRIYNKPSNATRATIDWVALYKGEKPMDWTPAPEEVYRGISGRNLVLDSEFKLMTNWIANYGRTQIESSVISENTNNVMTKVEATNGTELYQDFTQYISVEPNTTYTFSFNGGGTFQTFLWEKKADKTATAVYKDNAKSYTNTPFDMSSPRSNFVQTITTQPDTRLIQMIFRVRNNSTTGSTSGRFALPQLEKGSIATEWSPNPLDYNLNDRGEVPNGKNLIDNSLFASTTGYRTNWGSGTGNRTLVTNTDSIIASSQFNYGLKLDSTSSGEFGYAKDNVKLIQGAQYVLSAWAYIVTDGGIAKVQEGHQSVGWTSTKTTTVGKWVRIVHRFTAKSDNLSVYFGQDAGSPPMTMYITGVKLEKGIYATQWSLSDNDSRSGGRNLLRNSNFSSTKIDTSLAWDKTLNGTLVPDGWWSNGYNQGTSDPTYGYHAHLNTEKFGYPVIEFIDKNSTIPVPNTNPARNVATHRWLGMSNTVLPNDPLAVALDVGKAFTVSMDVMSDTVGMSIRPAFYHFEIGNNTQGMYGYEQNLEPCKTINVWERKTYTIVINEKWDTSKSFAFYIYGQYSNMEGTMWVRNIKIEEGYNATDYSPAQEDFYDKINNIQISGRNLLRNTGYIHFNSTTNNPDNWNISGGSSVSVENEPTALSGKAMKVNVTGNTTGGTHNPPVMDLTVGERYTWTVYLKATRNMKVKVGSEMSGQISCDVTTTWQKFTHSFIAKSVQYKSFTFYYEQDGGANASFYIHSAQLEKGDRNSALWSCAPEDYDKQLSAIATRLDQAELKITDSAIVATVTKSTEFKGKADANTVYTKEEIANMGTPQLLHNTEWNSDSKWWTVNSGWTLDFTKRFEGVTSFKCVVTGTASNGYPAIFSEFIDTKEGRVFTASGYVYTDNKATFDQGGSIEIEWYNSSNTRIGTASKTLVPSANGQWERKSVSGVAPANTVKARIRFHPIRNGSFWVAKPMFQYGDMLTAWSPSIDELATDLTSQITQTAGRIDIVVGSDNKIKAEQIASAISLTPSAITLISNNINLTGRVTFSSLNSSLQGNITDFNNMTTTYGGKTVIDGNYIRSGTISGVTINVDTDLQVGKEIRLGSMTDFSLKMLRFNNSANISTTNGNVMNISSMTTQIVDGDVIIGSTINTSVYRTYLQGTIDVSGVTSWIGGIPAVFG